MNTLEIVAVLIVLLIAILIFLKKRKKCSSCSSKETLISKPKSPEQVKPQPETRVADEPIAKAESSAKPQTDEMTVVSSPEPKVANKPVINIEPSAKPQAKETAVPSPENNSSILPQDSILRRHYFTHLCTMIEALAPQRPTDSVLCRHFDTMIVTKIDQCLNDKKAMEQLICNYEKLRT